MSEKELFEKYAEICDHRQRRLMDVQESALFCALRDMLKKGARLAGSVNGPTQSTISHDDWYALCNERDALRADNERLRARLAEAERENELLRQAFKEYGFHHVDCLYETDACPCDCGYHDVKVQLQRLADSAGEKP
jgi:hypothetical protein